MWHESGPQAYPGVRRAVNSQSRRPLRGSGGLASASRIQGPTKDFEVDILISEATRKSIDPTVAVEEPPAVRVKGRVEEINVYKVV